MPCSCRSDSFSQQSCCCCNQRREPALGGFGFGIMIVIAVLLGNAIIAEQPQLSETTTPINTTVVN